MSISSLGASSAMSLYNYQTALTSALASGASTASAQSIGALQALTSAYGTSTDYSSGDPLADVAGDSALASMVSGIYSASAATGSATDPVVTLTPSMTTAVGGTSAGNAASLLSSLGTDGLDGFPTQDLGLDSTLDMTAYTVAQDGLPSGPLTSVATSLAAGIDTSTPSDVQSAIQAATASVTSGTVNLLA